MKFLLFIIIALSFSNNFSAQADSTSEKKQFIYVIRLTEKYWQESAWDQDASNTVQAHFKHLQDMLADGKLVFAGRTEIEPDKTFGIVVFEAASIEEAKETAQNDPAVKAGIMSVEVFPYKIALMRK